MSKVDRKHEATGKGAHARHGHGPKDDDHKAEAHGEHKAHHEKKKHEAWRDEFRDADKNHNGKLSKSELKIPKAERRIYDHNHNGRIGKHEFKVGYRKIQRLDKNDDGHLSKHELHPGGHGHAHGGHGHSNGGHHGHVGGSHGHGGHGGGKAKHHGHGGGSHASHGGHHGSHGGPVNLGSAPTGGPDRPQAPGSVHGDTDFNISSFNVLGSSHTAAGGNKPGMASGVQRIREVVQLLDQHHVSVAGLQEFQDDQAREFKRLTGNQYGMFSGRIGKKTDTDNTIVWRKDQWDLVKSSYVSVPYFEGHVRQMPVVRLRNKETGQEAYFINVHNPANTKDHPNNEANRDRATRIETALINRLRKQTGLPVFITGDMNEHAEFRDHMAKDAPGMHASAGREKNPGIDWIFGSPNVRFTRHVRDRGAKVRHASDHPMIVSQAHIG